ncbi:APC family permease [Martelella alba]|uniref:APC family permease n=1 Tax=Martelella alba TaxID=2590451 RepID=A0A506U3A9_9HYPH|nr:APC family permease [Martelella alba]TPW28873.1 APC family permease [Martelella alba]
MAMRREIGLMGLTFVAVSGVLGSGWLFAPLDTAQMAGPASLISWLIGAVAMLLIALTYAEIATLFPIAGGLARIPQFSHGRLLALAMGWSAWVGYCTTAPIEVKASLGYASSYLPWLTNASGNLTVEGMLAAAAFLAVLTVVNLFGVTWFARLNTAMTWFKLIVPLIFVVVVIASRFEPGNFTNAAAGGFAPFGTAGIFSAVATGGVVFAFIGFRHAIDLAGEVRNSQRVIPLALILSVLICLFVYIGLQLAFIGAQSPADLAGGWAKLEASHHLGPLGALATSLGVLWMVSLLNVAAIVSPAGSGLVSTSSNARLALAMSNNGVFPRLIARLNVCGVPAWALLLNYVVALAMLILLPFSAILALNGSAVVLSFIAGPVSMVAFRMLVPGAHRPFRVPAVKTIGAAAFIIATLMIYWSGWSTMWLLDLLLAIGAALFFIRLAFIGREDLEPQSAIWFGIYMVGLTVLSYFGGYGGGIGVVPHPVDSIIAAVFSLAMFFMAVKARISQDMFNRFMHEQKVYEREEYGRADDEDQMVSSH